MTTQFKQMKKSEILALARDVADSLKTIGNAEVNRLAKGEGSSSSSSSSEASLGKGSIPAEGSSASSASSGSPEGSSGSPGSPGDLGDEGSAPPGDLPPGGPEGSAPPPGPEGSAPPPGAEGSAPPGAPPPGAEGQAPQGPSFEELVSLYAALPPPDLEAHAAAMQQVMSMKQGAGGPPGAPPAGPPGASPSAPPGAPPMGKQEVATADPNIGLKPGGGTPGKVTTADPNIGPTKKSEGEEQLAKLTKNVEDLGKVLETILTVPQRKATTGLTVIPYQGNLQKSQTEKPLKKSIGDMTRAEVHEALKVVTATPKLTKAERDVVNEFYMNPGAVKLADLEIIINK